MNNQHISEPGTPDNVGTPEDTSFGDILSQFEQEHSGAGGQEALEGTVITVTDEAVMVDVGRKLEGAIPLDQVKDPKGNVTLVPGAKLQVTITGRDTNGYYTLSTVKVVTPRDWSGLEKAFADKAIIPGTVEEVIKGGLRVDVGVRAFMPASRSGTRDQAEMEKLVGQQIECRITKLDTAKEDVVVDRRGVLEERAAEAKQKLFDALEEGAIVEGEVRNVMDFGAFIDLGGVDGLLHVMEMTWQRGAKASDVVKVGDKARVKILKINRESRKISLGMKQLMPDPWTTATETLKVGEKVKGKVTRLADFGAFVEVLPGVEGLIHVSEMSWSRKQLRVSEILTAGEMVEAVVLGVNPAEKRIALGLKQALGDPWESAVAKYPVGSVVEAPVTNMQSFGAFVELGEGVEGMIHIGDITREKRLEHPKEMLATGKVVRAQVMEIDGKRRRIRLSMKQLEPTGADEYIAEHKVGDVVSGRVLDVGKDRAKVELGEGITASCKLAAGSSKSDAPAESGKADLSALTAMLEAKWKKGGASAGDGGSETPRSGQIRQFRIVNLEPGKKHIDLELAG